MMIQTLAPFEDAFAGKIDISADEVGFDFGVGNLDTRIYSVTTPDGKFIKKLMLQPNTTFNIRAFAVIGDNVIFGNKIESTTDAESRFKVTSHLL